jgi:FAD/FMN-containing dehydrogenase
MHPSGMAGARSTGAAVLAESLRGLMRGDVIERGDAEYDDVRRVWNGLVDRHPLVIARCADAGDVVAAVKVAREHRPLVSVRGGGHQIAGSAVCDDGLVIDLSAMRNVLVDTAARRVVAAGGATWRDVDAATQADGLAVPGGEVSTTGIGGFTLGGGMGLIMRAHGLACDALRAIEIVTADGALRRASPHEHAELFWAARGGGRGIGVVTSFEFEAYPLGPDVAVVQAFYPWEDAARILADWTALAVRMPETVTPQAILWSVPADPSIPEELHGRKTLIVAGLYCGAPDDGAAVLEPLRRLGMPFLELSGTMPYVAMQSSVDELFPTGGRYYMKSHMMRDLPRAAIDIALEWDARRPTPQTLIAIRTLGGAVSRVSREESAFAHRDARFNFSIDAGWTDPRQDAEAIGWARGMWDALAPFASGVYINFSGLADEADALRDSVFGASTDRLAEVRRTYDPEGLFAAAARQP